MALSQERNTPARAGGVRAYPVAAGVTIWSGSLVGVESGYARPARANAASVAVGRARSTVVNTTGGNGGVSVEVEQGTFCWDNSAGGDEVTQAHVGSGAYAADDCTVAATTGGGTRPHAGVVVAVDAQGVWVETVSAVASVVLASGVRFAAAEGDIDTAEGRLDTAEGRLDTAEDDIDAVEGRLDVVEAVPTRRTLLHLGAPAAPAGLHAAYAGGQGVINDVSGPWSAIGLPARALQTVGSAGCATGVMTVTGTGQDGAALEEDIAFSASTTTKGTKAFATVTKVETDTDPGEGATVTLQTGPGLGLGGPVTAIHALAVGGVVEAAVLSAPADGVVEPTTAPNGTRVYLVQVTR
jgi:hypothetical protein